jgi:hypothetical protein
VDLQKRAEKAGLSWATVRRAKGALGVKARKLSMEEGWTWEIARGSGAPSRRCSRRRMSAFDDFEHLRRYGVGGIAEDAQ